MSYAGSNVEFNLYASVAVKNKNNYSEVSFSFCLRFSFFKKKNEVAPLGAKQPTIKNSNQSDNNIYVQDN
jgi:hypothetical protein